MAERWNAVRTPLVAVRVTLEVFLLFVLLGVALVVAFTNGSKQ